jgi:hypothetical protein
MYDISLASDGIVSTASSQGYSSGGPGRSAPKTAQTPVTVSCAVNSERLALAAARFGGSEQLAAAWSVAQASTLADSSAFGALGQGRVNGAVVALLGLVDLTAPCSHTGMTSNPASWAQIGDAVGRYQHQLAATAVAFPNPTGANFVQAAVAGIGLSVGLPAEFTDASKGSYPVGWLDRTANRLLLTSYTARQTVDAPVKQFVAVDVRSRKVVGSAECRGCDLLPAADDPSVVGGLSPDVRDGQSPIVTRYDASLRQVSTAQVTGLPTPGPNAAPPQLLAVRAAGLVVALPGPEGTGGESAYGGPQRFAVVDWAGHARLLPQPTPHNTAATGAVLSPDGRHLAYDTGARGGGCINHHAPHVVDLVTGADVAAPVPAPLQHGDEVYSQFLHWVSAVTLSFSWENSGMNGDWNTPCRGDIQVPPRVYDWTPSNGTFVGGPARTMFRQRLSDGSVLTVPWSAPQPFVTASYPVVLNGRELGAFTTAPGTPPMLP